MMDQSVLGYDKYEKRKRYPKESFIYQLNEGSQTDNLNLRTI